MTEPTLPSAASGTPSGARSVAPSGEPPGPAVVIDVWSDLVCPWCYLGRHRLRTAVAAWHRPAEVLVRSHAYELDPSAARGTGIPVTQMLGEKLGGGEQAGRAMTQQVTAVAADDGLRLDFSHAVAANSFDGHRLVALALASGGPPLQDAVLERLFSAHFTEGLAIDDHATLLRTTAEAGLDERRVAAVLASDEHADDVRHDEEQARELGIASVPFFVANGRVAVSGAQPVDTFLRLLDAAEQPAGG